MGRNRGLRLQQGGEFLSWQRDTLLIKAEEQSQEKMERPNILSIERNLKV